MEPSTVAIDARSYVDPDGTVTEAVVATVAEARGVGSLDLSPLYYAVDPDALSEFVRPEAPGAQSLAVEFRYEGCDVVVRADGEVAARESSGPTGRAAAADREGGDVASGE